MRIETQTEFEAWLESNFWLHDVLINALEPYPRTTSENGGELPSQVKLVGTLQVGGSYRAGETRWMRDIEIVVQGIKSYCIDWEEGFIAGNCCQGIELIEVEQGLGFTLDVPGILQVVCTSIEALQYPDREELVEPWFSSDDFFANAILQTVPTPEDWMNHFHKQGWDVVWRYYYSDEQALDRVPVDYTGWFVQLRSRLDENPQGLFFRHCQLEGERFSLSLRNYDPALQGLWIEAGKYVATFPEVSISCGNTTMNQVEWLAHLAQFDP
jgi:hypothetical protein